MSRGPKTIRLANVRIRSQRALENDTMHSFTKCEASLSFSIPSNLHLIRRISYVCYDATPSQLKPFFACMSGVGGINLDSDNPDSNFMSQQCGMAAVDIVRTFFVMIIIFWVGISLVGIDVQLACQPQRYFTRKRLIALWLEEMLGKAEMKNHF